MNEQPFAATEAETRVLEQLHDRLGAAAELEGLTDLSYRVVDSPLGKLLLAATEQGMVRLAFDSENHEAVVQYLSDKVGSRMLRNEAKFDAAAKQLDEYFSGIRKYFELPLDLRLSTDFRRTVQLELGAIDYGQTRSYAEVAQRIGKPNAVRAVGTACATNPLPIVLPCHRVLRSDGTLGGYLGGLAAKRVLLDLESQQLRNP